MSQLSALTKKELRLYFNSPIAYVFLTVFLTLATWLFFRGFFLIGQADLRAFFSVLPWFFLFLVPAMTMRLWSEEYRLGTIETLLTSSIRLPTIIAGKFVASLVFLAIALACTLPLPITIAFLGPLDIGATVAAYVGALLLGSALIALGLLISALSNNQIVAFILAVAASFALYIIGTDLAVYALPGWLAPIFSYISLASHYDAVTRGVLDTRDLVYYCSTTAFFLYLNYYVLVQKK